MTTTIIFKMANIVASINPFPNDVRVIFQEYLQSDKYTNRESIPYKKWNQMHVFLHDPTLKPEDPTESNLKHRALTEFQLVRNRLYRLPDKAHTEPRYVVPESEAFDLIVNEHLKLLHAGRDKT